MREQNQIDAERYRKLRKWMSSNVSQGWNEVERLASVGCYVGWDDFDAYLDEMPECNVGLCYKRPEEGETDITPENILGKKISDLPQKNLTCH
jgi:hypothetical protein